jgi:hypothetical protein
MPFAPRESKVASRNEIKRRKHARLKRIEQERQAHRAAERRYAMALEHIVAALGLSDLFRSLPVSERRALALFRFRAIRVEPAQGVKIPRRVLDYLRKFISIGAKISMVEITPGKGKVSLEDYITAGRALIAYAKTPGNDDVSEDVLLFRNQLIAIDHDPKNEGTGPLLQFMIIVQIAGMTVSRVNQTMYYLMPSVHDEGSGLARRVSTVLFIHQVKPEAMNVVIEGKPRPAWRVGWPLAGTGMRWATLSARDLGVDSALADIPMKVYIQSHALIRLMQRVDTLDYISQHSGIFSACDKKEVVTLPDNRALVAFHVNGKKLGYFFAEIVTGIVVFRTFLFVTNSGTPEGDRLDHELRIGKIEKEFLHIDTLSAFVKTDMMLDARVVDVFERVGLGHLCNLDPEQFGKRSPLATGYAADFVKFMGLG